MNLILAIVMMILLVACSNNQTSNEKESDEAKEGLVSVWTFDKQDIRENELQDKHSDNNIILHRENLDKGVIGDALRLDGEIDKGTSKKIIKLSGPSERTVMFWFNLEKLKGDQPQALFHWGGVNPGRRFGSIIYQDGKIGFNGYKADHDWKTDFVPEINRWYNMVWTYGRENVSLFINGKYIASTYMNLDTMEDYLRLGFISSGGEWWFLKGLVDEFYIWNKVLSAEEIQHYYNNGNGRRP